MREQLPDWFPGQTLNLGLDLQGGSYLLLEVDTVALRKEKQTALVEDVRKTLRDNQIEFTDLGQVGGDVTVRIVDPAQVDTAYSALNRLSNAMTNGSPDLTVTRTPDQRLRLAYAEQALREQEAGAVDQSIEIIRRRIDPEGNKEIPVTARARTARRQAGRGDPERLKNIIGQQQADLPLVADRVTRRRSPPPRPERLCGPAEHRRLFDGL